MAENTGTGWAGGKNAFGDFAPGMVHYTGKVLFDEVSLPGSFHPRLP